jgi:short-subunit dehydrogenase
MMKERVLITGASSGIGLALAKEFAGNGHSLVIVSPVQNELEDVAWQIQKVYDVDILPMAADLRDQAAPQYLFDQLHGGGVDIHILVNNAGLGQKGDFAFAPLERDVDIIRLNIEAVIRMTKLFLKPMLEVNYGRVVNTASVAGFEPGPSLSVYHASKAFVLSFTEALAVELEQTGITVTALCPGATDTDFFPKAGMTNAKVFQKGNVMAPAKVAEIAYTGVMRGDPICVTGAANKALVAARRFMTVSATAKLNRKFYEEVPRTQRRRQRGDVERTYGFHERHHGGIG